MIAVQAMRTSAVTAACGVLTLLMAASRAQAQDQAPDREATEPIVNVTIRANRLRPPAGPKDTSVAGTVISGDSLRGAGLQSADVLRGQPGLSVVETGGMGAPSTASLRGATSAQTPVYLGGVRLNDDIAGTADLSLVPLWLIDRVEIYRGNAPIEADQLGIGGAVFFEPRKPHRAGAEAGVLAGSFGARAGWANASVGDEQASALVGVRDEGAQNDYSYIDDRGTRFDSSDDVQRHRTNADVRTLDVWALGNASIGAGADTTLMVNGVRRDQGVPGLSLLPSRAARASFQRSLFAATVRSPCQAQRDRCMLVATSAALLASSAFEDPLSEIALGAPRLDVRGNRSEQSVLARVDVSDRTTLTPSVHAAVEHLDVVPVGSSGLYATRVLSRGALGAEFRATDWVAVKAVSSGECNGTSQQEAQFCDRVNPSGRLGIALGPPQLRALANIGRYVRVPTLGELYGMSALVRGNPSLAAEQAITLDTGLRASWGQWGPMQGAFLDVFAFVRTSDDLVAWRRSSLGFVRPYNVGSARVSGIEALGGVAAFSGVRAEVSATLMDPRDTTATRTATNDILPFRSRLIVSPHVEFRTQAFAPAGVNLARLDVRYVYQSSRYADEAGLVIIPSQASLDLEGELRFLGEHLLTRVRVANVLDQTRLDVIGYVLPPRACYMTAEVRW
jgi:vitamin B12 transporter